MAWYGPLKRGLIHNGAVIQKNVVRTGKESLE